MRRVCLLTFVAMLCVPAEPAPAAKNVRATVLPWARVTNLITPGGLRGRVSFLASDLLEGRKVGERGLDLAGEYAASVFRSLGLDPGGAEDSYFQPVPLASIKSQRDGLRFSLSWNGASIQPAADQVQVSGGQLATASLAVVKCAYTNEFLDSLSHLRSGSAIVCEYPKRDNFAIAGKIFDRVKSLSIPLLLALDTAGNAPPPVASVHDPEAAAGAPVRLRVRNAEFTAMIGRMDAGLVAGAELTLGVPAASSEPVPSRNVIALLRGTDPVLKNSWVMVSAHYDHVGTGGKGPDKVYNGANDDASGTAAVLEIASALVRSGVKPKRSVAFILFTAEELGLLGSNYYARHPAIPLAQTIADINLEVLGLPARPGAALITGAGFSTLGRSLAAAAAPYGVKIRIDQEADEFFERSDNLAFAAAGIPAHTVGAGLEYPDYHQPGDEWAKLDYDHMARITRGVTAAILNLANSAAAPAWIATNSKVSPYVTAAKKLLAAPKTSAAPASPSAR